MGEGPVADVAIDFIAFCFELDHREWPRLYDTMCLVASKRLYRGLGYEELKDAGIDLTINGVPKLSRTAKEVTRQLAGPRNAGVLATT